MYVCVFVGFGIGFGIGLGLAVIGKYKRKALQLS